jgi:hypothetical protein
MWIYFELPNTDAYGTVRTLDEMTKKLSEFGNPPVHWDIHRQCFKVPAFKEGRERAIKSKLKTILGE